MVFTYLILNVSFLIIAALLLKKHLPRLTKAWWLTLLILLLLTAVFDSMIIWAGIVGYTSTKTLGLFIGLAPVEDFFYALLAVLVVPALWNLFQPKLKATKKEPENGDA